MHLKSKLNLSANTVFLGCRPRFLLTSDENCPRYAMRLMEIARGGYTSLHNHKEEHEMYFPGKTGKETTPCD